ncbi:MAG: hypothetical protein EPN85_03650 [Bacteroidetes bacterium]|nr:MAG: hypothetical protein EPN85_03650 [Bacteroidota bacterium]
MFGIILAIGYTALFIFLIRKIKFFQTEHISQNLISLVFILKIIAGTALWFVYTRHYSERLTADIFKYFDDGKVIYNALFSKPIDYFKMLFGIPDASLNHYYRDDMRHWSREFNQGMYNENRTLIRFNALIDVFSFGHYHVHTVFMCFLSTMGLMGIFKTFSSFLSGKTKELFVVTFLLPSVIFWSSGVLKEGLILFALGMCLYHYYKLLNEKIAIPRIAWLGMFLFLLSITKLYILLIILPVLTAHAWISKTNYSYPEIKYLAALAIYFSIGLLMPKYNFPFMLMEKQRQAVYMAQGGSYLANHDTKRFVYIDPKNEKRIIPIKGKPGFCKIVPGVPYVSWNMETFLDSAYIEHASDTNAYWIFYNQAAAGSNIKIPSLNGTFLSILKNTPVAFSNTFLRPYIFETKNPLMLLSAIENCLILVITFVCVLFCYKNVPNRHLVYFCLTTVILLFALIGLTTPVMGASVRYKIPVLPFLLIAFLLILDKEKLLKKFPFLKKIIA